VTHSASSRGHVLGECTNGSNGLNFSVRERVGVQVPSSVDADDAPRELKVTLLGFFPVGDEFVTFSVGIASI